ncbi:exosome complex component RRP43-like isoform X2 [Schistocerca americana]|uniref:exosome complex component RRP43-like isoform X2 n=1 Tax=Schistocerca americana TaxID=7009 RepID=UPI001F5006AF|nr:exosome complex component RRP43-like isoform X2 [Schistocerca americana]XP_047120959.1 exosome complex component RRP43-like isoform X3 [Schistocerca piceifrons]XP_049790688.1 exosome complex component RRP43-like isoform X2 [Schistocerca nitens]XP_049937557.1 exosome complex component RRP43-like isoform X2 [Schistocerca serialis cubense]
MAAQYKTIHPVKYLRDYLAHEIRPDGRTLMKFRPASINVGSVSTADGSSVVKIGNTTVVCGIKAELVAPKTEEPESGFIVPNVTLPPLCSPKFRPGPPSALAQTLTHLVASIVMNSQCLKLQDLCIAPEHLVWVLHCDMVCLDHDGALLDACLTALLAALKTISLPTVEYNADEDKKTVNLRKRTPLIIDNIPVATTFAIIDNDIVIADPTNEEESMASGVLSIVIQGDQLSSVHKPGGTPLLEMQLQNCISAAKERSQLVNNLICAAVGQ